MIKLGKAMGYSILIEPSLNFTYIATLGCMKLTFDDIDELTAAISAYLRDPEEHEEMFFKEFGGGVPQPTEAINVGVESDRPLGCV